jgi:hypothetical protein
MTLSTGNLGISRPAQEINPAATLMECNRDG